MATAAAEKKHQIGIVGSGPAGFYTAYRLLSRLSDVVVDVYEALPAPFGLARYGVAPDHPEVKNATHKFDEVARDSRFNFFGNIVVGKDVMPKDLAASYDAVVYAYGASESRALDVPGEHLPGVLNARDVVAWYNGLPGFTDLDLGLDEAEHVSVIGQGNVALDLARLLLVDVDVLRKTDIADHALEQLSRSRVKNVSIVGRRGPLQASFTIKEVRELLKLEGVRFDTSGRQVYEAALQSGPLARPTKRLIELLRNADSEHSARSWRLLYNRAPRSFVGTTRVEAVELEENDLVRVGDRVTARGTGRTESLPTQLALKSVGYQAKPLPGMSDAGLVFDTTRHILPNERGRVVSLDAVIRGAYCCGWIKNGPVGVIATTMHDAFESADAVVEDLTSSSQPGESKAANRAALIRDLQDRVQVVDWQAWLKIDVSEIAAGEAQHRPRCKTMRISDMLQIARS